MANLLTPQDLCERYKGKISLRTLANWRSEGSGPSFTKIGGRVFYALDAVLRWEKDRTRETDIRSIIALMVSASVSMVAAIEI